MPATEVSFSRSERRACLDKITEARPQLDDELANLHRVLGEEKRPQDQQHDLQRDQRRDQEDELRDRRSDLERPRSRDRTPPARAHERDVNRRINKDAAVDGGDAPLFKPASQNLVAAAMLLCGCPEPTTPKEKRVCQQLKTLLETAT
jgi:hypothetical protein